MYSKITVETKPYNDQKPQTSGLRKRVSVYEQVNYLENFTQSIFDVLDLTNGTILVSGDGRYFSKTAIQTILCIAAGNDVSHVLIALDGLCSTPAASAIIREYKGGICKAGFILTASHNPGGASGDFGFKINLKNGQPAPEQITEQIYEKSKVITKYYKVDLDEVRYDELGTFDITPNFKVSVIDRTSIWLDIMKHCFDFSLIRILLKSTDFKLLFDGMNGVAGPYAAELFLNELGIAEKSLQQYVPKEDFGGLHPDPTPANCKKLISRLGIYPQSESEAEFDFGAACDGDADRNMIIGKGIVVSPSDSLAVITEYANKCIKQFSNKQIGVALSMPTSRAVIKVCQNLGYKYYITPTGWKYFCNLLDANLITICGEESYGTGSFHIREKDGLWAILAWLSILAYEYVQHNRVVSVKEIIQNHWNKYGRYYYVRYDYEYISSEIADVIYNDAIICKSYSDFIENVEEFTYKDPINYTISKKQGVQIFFKDGSRVIIRKSGTGSIGATLRIYIERYDKYNVNDDPIKRCNVIGEKIIELLQISKRTNIAKPIIIA